MKPCNYTSYKNLVAHMLKILGRGFPKGGNNLRNLYDVTNKKL